MDLPADFIIQTKDLLEENWERFLSALNEEPPVSIRLNRYKTSDLYNSGLSGVPWCNEGYYLEERPQFTFDPLLHAGCYYVQEASSMFIGQAIKQYTDKDMCVLDLCAAPGGKSTLIADSINEDSLLVSNEVIRSRANILSENMAKWGKANVVVTNNDPSHIGKIGAFFDIILVDAPCSGEGMFRKDKGAIDEWSVGNVRLCKERQQRILADIWPALKDEGILIYSTCTYNTEENEENVKWIRDELGAEVLSVEVNDDWNISPSAVEGITAYRFFPHKTKGEGFFCAVLRKTSVNTGHDSPRRLTSTKDKKGTATLSTDYKNFILDNENYSFHNKGDLWYAVSEKLRTKTEYIDNQLNTTSKGIYIGEFKGRDFIPGQALALSNVLNRQAFDEYEADWETAISYLRKEALVLPDQPKGYILLTYRDKPLGFVKNIGNRANNLYPQEWRIRSTNIPDREIMVI